MVELVFFFLGADADLVLDLWVSHDHEMPGLQVSPVGGGPRGDQALFDDLAWDRAA